ncbi:MAG: YihA family ribosome biogenesis GTP-binding protein [Kordiimonas sp.]|nr:YihA family ribosome biogenesis GTP-binding protein [Kordiimonas sp.]
MNNPDVLSVEEQEARLEKGRLLFAQNCDFLKGVVALEGLPSADRVEVAFAGRSNVGKSSLINALTRRKSLARTSNTPGRTQELNFFTLGDPQALGLYLVDLPGYGYAKVSRSLVEQWTALLKAYLRGRATLRRVLIMIDARHGIKQSDLDIMAMLDEAAVSYQIILTKADKLKLSEKKQIVTRVKEDIRKRVAAHPDVILTSAVKGDGIDEVRAIVAELAGQ